MAKKLLPQKYRHKQKRMSKMTYSESEADSDITINSLLTFAPIFSDSISESDDSESDFYSVFINLDAYIFWSYICIVLNKLVDEFFYQFS